LRVAPAPSCNAVWPLSKAEGMKSSTAPRITGKKNFRGLGLIIGYGFPYPDQGKPMVRY
jgi:hypothetical protein